ncbi:SCO2322 family protein [Streptomyces sp. HC307]|uniref:SCO2322 family protein n=1 Tax=Streptomyces flavusporus TaxID=3385496 RepID=UPI003916FF55
MIRRTALLLATCLFALAGSAGQAQAVGYRYWSFWDRAGDQWTYATQGPSTARPADGDVQGFRFSVSEDSKDSARPRDTADFATICAKTPAQEGRKRVALVIDFGTPTDAPSGETPPPTRTACAAVASDATTAEALATIAKPLRYDTNALLCAIAGYPETGCGEQVKTEEKQTASEKKDKGTDESEGPSVGVLAAIAAIAALGAATGWQARRRRNG